LFAFDSFGAGGFGFGAGEYLIVLALLTIYDPHLLYLLNNLRKCN